MMGYKIQKKKDKQWLVVEIQTKYVLAQYRTKEEAADHARHLNLGAGFNGITPKFMLERRLNRV